jgi:hypothetical protein
VTDETLGKLRTLLQAYAAGQGPGGSRAAAGSATDRKRRVCAEGLRNIVLPVLTACMTELQSAGHDASTRDHTERDDAYPSVALSFTPRPSAVKSPEVALASALMFKYDPRRGIVVQRDVKPSPAKPRVAAAASTDRTGTIGVDAVSAQWAEQKALAFIEDVLKAN